VVDPSEITAARHALGRLLAKYRQAAGLNQRQLAPHTHYCRSTIANVETGRQHVPRAFWQRCEQALNAGGALLAAADQLEDLIQRQREETTQLAHLERERQQRQPGLRQVAELAAPPEQVGALLDHIHDRRSFLAASGVAAFGSAPARVLQALEIVTTDHADTLGAATDCLNELISHYSEKLPVSPPTDMYDDLLNVRSYAGRLLQRLRSPTRHRSDLIVAAGWLSNLLAVAASYLGDQESALIWCVDAERRGYESGHPDIAGWAALARAVIAYYQGRAGRSTELAGNGQEVAPVGTVAHAKLVAQEMRARAMLGDVEGMVQAKRRAAKATAELPSDVATTGVFSIALSEDPPYTATSLLLVRRFREAASATKGILQAAYPAGARNRNRQSSNYARTLLILGLAEAGLGHVDEAVAAGRAALDSTGVVWPTVVLAGKLDQSLMRDHKDAAEVAEYHTRYLAVVGRASNGFQHAGSPLATRERNG
jgi:hypothetical protein